MHFEAARHMVGKAIRGRRNGRISVAGYPYVPQDAHLDHTQDRPSQV